MIFLFLRLNFHECLESNQMIEKVFSPDTCKQENSVNISQFFFLKNRNSIYQATVSKVI